MITSKVTSKGQVTIPKAIREFLKVKPGDQLDFVIEDDEHEEGEVDQAAPGSPVEVDATAGTEKVIPADLVLLALGFTGVEGEDMSNQSNIALDNRGNVQRQDNWSTNADGVFVAGDAGRGQSLIVWAIAEGRSAAAAIDEYLEGTSELPRPVKPTDRPISI